jgi:hypothetical protein
MDNRRGGFLGAASSLHLLLTLRRPRLPRRLHLPRLLQAEERRQRLRQLPPLQEQGHPQV